MILTPFVFAVTHERFLHGFRCLNFIFFLDRNGMGCRDNSLGDHFQCFNNAYIAEFLCDIQGSLSIL